MGTIPNSLAASLLQNYTKVPLIHLCRLLRHGFFLNHVQLLSIAGFVSYS